jgi:hypothetical protein
MPKQRAKSDKNYITIGSIEQKSVELQGCWDESIRIDGFQKLLELCLSETFDATTRELMKCCASENSSLC